MKIRTDIQNRKWLLGVSGGGDSMALLALCIEANMDVMVAHMNYQKRDSANRDMEGVQTYCAKHNIPCFIKLQDKPCVGNFQAFAREERYRFFYEIISTYHLDGVLVAHHLDDHLETYIMQKMRHVIPQHYGIHEEVELFGCLVVRPLLLYTKAELEFYCEQHHVPYFLDESNLSEDYTRNQIRHQIIAKMSKEEKEILRLEISQKNIERADSQARVQDFLAVWQGDVASLLKLSQKMFLDVMQTWIYQTIKQHVSVKEIAMIHQGLDAHQQWCRPLSSTFDIYYSYGFLSIEHQSTSYAYVYDTLTYEKTPYFTCAKEGGSVEALTLCDEDFPITIRNVEKQDVIEMRFGTKKIHRWFIDRKIPLFERKSWPVVCNRDGKIVLVPKIGCDISHFSNNPNLFVIK